METAQPHENGGPGPAQGVNVVGFFRAEFGQGEAARRLVAGLERARVPVRTLTYDRIPHRQEHPFDERAFDGFFPTNIVCLNAEHLLSFARGDGRELLAGRYSVGLWFWETNRLPRELRPGLGYVDEIWVASPFVADAISAETSKPVLTFPLPVVAPPPSGLTRAHLGLADDAFVFAYVFDFFSTIERKNPLGLIEAFTRAFPERDRPLLYLKTINGDRSRDELARVRAAAAGRPDIRLDDGYVAGDRLAALTQHCDCYGSLHRSEGFGLTIAEAMALGKPVIATGYSGNLAFMTPENSYLCPASRTEIGPEREPYPAQSYWSEPDLTVAARLLRQVYENPAEADARGRRAAEDIRTRHSSAVAGKIVCDRLITIRRRRSDRGPVRTIAFLQDRIDELQAQAKNTPART